MGKGEKRLKKILTKKTKSIENEWEKGEKHEKGTKKIKKTYGNNGFFS